MFNFKNLKLVVAFLSLFVLISFIQETYAKYNTEAEGQASVNIARWQISINDQDIITDSYITNVITPTLLNNPNVKDGVIAPQSLGYFDLILNYTNVDVSFNYGITTSISPNSGVSDLKVTGYSENGGAIIPVNGSMTNIGKDIPITNTNRTNNIRVYITWEDSDDESMNNSADTTAAINQGKAILNVAIKFKQITG